MRWGGLAVLLAALAFATSSSGSSAAEPTGLQLELVTGGLSAPVHVATPPGENARFFIVQQGSGGEAQIRLFADGNLTTFLTVTEIITGGEEGLLSMAFHPQ